MTTTKMLARLLGAMALVTACMACAAPPTSFEALDGYLQTELQRAGIPGAALVVVADGRIVHLHGYGVSGPDGRLPTPDTVFQIGSNSKSFTALAVMQLAEAGRLQLDAPVQRYLPWFRVADADASARITLRQLLNQTSGFAHREGQTDFANAYAGADALERRVRALAGVRLASVPGQRWAYSNINFVILGCVIEAVSGTPYARYMSEHVFEPLGMRNTAAASQSPAHADVAKGYRFWFGKAIAADGLPYPQTLVPAGYLTSTARDMGTYLIAHLGGGPRIVSASGLAELHRAGANTGQRYGYAMGWATERDAPGLLTHEGQTPEFTSAMGIDLQRRSGFALLLNASDALAGPVVLRLGPQLVNYLRGAAPVALESRAAWPPVLIALAALLALQGGIGVWLVRRTARPPSAPGRWPVLRIWWPPAAGLLLAAALVVYIPMVQEIDLKGMLLFAPDATWLLLLNAVLALCLGVFQTLLGRRRGEPGGVSRPA
ncbi:serine hydrolase [Rugamonas sp. FT82W]|uniref:Serine hydrolase n=1 Tax=Duganella vulcania TaxID=2692166 RepID=A0A845FY83_9BURK|nr:serine hydrolase domain-containing protein [Duganella vulcania]MYM87473.1 serine hydrolase [Duganella vulcania]